MALTIGLVLLAFLYAISMNTDGSKSARVRFAMHSQRIDPGEAVFTYVGSLNKIGIYRASEPVLYKGEPVLYWQAYYIEGYSPPASRLYVEPLEETGCWEAEPQPPLLVFQKGGEIRYNGHTPTSGKDESGQ